ncbi:MAG: tetratricopeptide repeat protein [Flavobacteriales bacterium]|nr:tetratricopeptide repeat protein [Flavobacteriales bacterium]MBK6946332.1 tetratricopeptide repeat protein [Flavobacteriales bacterium]MBK7239816.1 tetratricopeptide repeat protein [Flavobacteriales bacterium]MBK9536382.1 tetratricopeptide repeat protein [Flavobacteriales bacterium]MBP9139383.1 tetratricopeptide repeat protein [Flavobacteriales bacterium]
MWRSIILLLIVPFTTFCTAQDDQNDSLWNVYRTPGTPTRNKLEALNLLTNALRANDPDSSLTLAKHMVELAMRANDTFMVAEGLRKEGLAQFTKGATKKAIQLVDSGLHIFLLREDSAYLVGAANAESNLGFIEQQETNMDASIAHNRRSMALHLKAGHEIGLAYCYNDIGRAHRIQGRPDSALVCFAKVVEIAEKYDDEAVASWGYNNMIVTYNDMGRIGEAIDLAYKNIATMERLGEPLEIAHSYVMLSDLRASLGDPKEGFPSMLKAHELFTEIGDRPGMAHSLSGLGSLLFDSGRTDSAIIVLKNAYALEKEADLKYPMCQTMLLLGRSYRLMKNYEEAENILKESLVIAGGMDYQLNISGTLAELGKLDVVLDRPELAVTKCKQGLVIAERIKAADERLLNCECLYQAYKALGNGDLALAYHEIFVGVRDSLSLESTQRKLTQRDMLYTFNKEQLADSLEYAAEREQLESERTIESLRADQNRNRALATAFGGLLLLGGGGAWFVTDRKRRAERFEKEAATLETQALRSQMNPHFIFNALNSINAFVQKNDQDSATSYLSKFARVMRLVLENSRHAEVPLNDDLEALRGYLDLERMRMEKKFDFTITVDQTIDPEEVMVPPLVVQPFVENAIWHGMAGKEGKGHITLSVARRGSQMVWTIEDDGAGRHAKKEASPLGQPMKKTSLGTAITRSRLDLVQKQHGGKAGFHYTDLPQGTRVEVEIPFLNA